MNTDLKKYFSLENKSFIVKENIYVEVRIPDEYFESGISTVVGDSVTTFGFLDILVWDEYHEDLKDSDAVNILLRMPTIIRTSPSRITHDTKKSVSILEYHGGDKFITTTLIARKSEVVKTYIELLLRGKIPNDIPYNEIGEYLEKSMQINNVNLKANSIFFDIIVMMVSRDPGNLSRQFRELLTDNPKTSMLARKLINMDAIPSLTSQFSAITGGNPKYGITSSIGAIRSGDMVNEESDIEKAIK